jgi:molybdate transport system substrate-binding protein
MNKHDALPNNRVKRMPTHETIERRTCWLTGWRVGLLLATLCAQAVPLAASAATGPAPAPVIVFAATTIQKPLQELAQQFNHGQTRFEFCFDSSGVLAKKIENGAAADLFVAADTGWTDKLAQKGLQLPGTTNTILASTALIVIQPAGNTPIQALSDLPHLNRVAIGDPATVPAGTYAREALTNAGAWEGLAGKLVCAGNATAVIKLVELGEVDAGIVMTGAPVNQEKVRTTLVIPGMLHRPILYSAMRLKNGGAPEKAQAFFTFLGTPAAQAVLRNFGFTPAPEPASRAVAGPR